jgi:hypothetical protein
MKVSRARKKLLFTLSVTSEQRAPMGWKKSIGIIISRELYLLAAFEEVVKTQANDE